MMDSGELHDSPALLAPRSRGIDWLKSRCAGRSLQPTLRSLRADDPFTALLPRTLRRRRRTDLFAAKVTSWASIIFANTESRKALHGAAWRVARRVLRGRIPVELSSEAVSGYHVGLVVTGQRNIDRHPGAGSAKPIAGSPNPFGRSDRSGGPIVARA
jgi:hypothetical protein